MRSIGLFTMALTFICLLAAGLGGCDPTQTQETELGHHDHLAASNHQTPLLIDHETVLRFQRDWNTVASNLPVMAGGRLRVEYDPVRLPHCRATYNGAPAWNITMSYRSLPDGQTHQARLQPHGNMLMVVVPVPETGQDLELTFNNTDRQGCRAEDTNLNQGYRFHVSKPEEVATLVFDPSWSAESTRPLEQGGLMRIQYAPERLRTCRATYNGGRTWNIFASWEFSPGGQIGALALYEGNYYAGEAGISHPTVPIPSDATSVDLWFSNSDRSGCIAWDSNFADNYRFPVARRDGDGIRVGWAGDYNFIKVSRNGEEPLGDVDPAYYWYQSMPGAGQSTILEVQVWAHGLTDRHFNSDEEARDEAQSRLQAQLVTDAFDGNGPEGWEIVDLSRSWAGRRGNNFVYRLNTGNLGLGRTFQPGLFRYYFRFSTNGGQTWFEAGREDGAAGRRLVLAPTQDCSLFPDNLPPECPRDRQVGWAGNWGGKFTRTCTHQPGLSDPVVVTKSSLGNSCMVVSAEVWVEGVTDSQGNPSSILAQVETDLGYSGGPMANPVHYNLQYENKEGNNYRYAWYLDNLVGRADRGDYRFRFRFSADGGSSWHTIGMDEGPGGGAWRSLHIRNDTLDLDVEPETDCEGIILWSGATSSYPHCLNYTIDSNNDAANCEYFINALGRGQFSHNGASASWLEAYLSVGPQQGELHNVGMMVHYLADGEPQTAFSLGTEIEPHYWLVGFTHAQTNPGAGPAGFSFTHEVVHFAFFIDVERPNGDFVRLWSSAGGANFTIEEQYVIPGHTRSLGSGSVEYAAHSAPIFDQKRACE